MPARGTVLPIGKGRIMREGKRVALVSLGTRLAEALKAAEQLEAMGVSTTVADARFAKPLDEDMLLRLAKNHEALFTLEEGSSGGFGAAVLTFLAEARALDKGAVKVRAMTLPDRYQEHDSPERMYEAAGLDAKSIVRKVLDTLSDSALIRHNKTA